MKNLLTSTTLGILSAPGSILRKLDDRFYQIVNNKTIEKMIDDCIQEKATVYDTIKDIRHDCTSYDQAWRSISNLEKGDKDHTFFRDSINAAIVSLIKLRAKEALIRNGELEAKLKAYKTQEAEINDLTDKANKADELKQQLKLMRDVLTSTAKIAYETDAFDVLEKLVDYCD